MYEGQRFLMSLELGTNRETVATDAQRKAARAALAEWEASMGMKPLVQKQQVVVLTREERAEVPVQKPQHMARPVVEPTQDQIDYMTGTGRFCPDRIENERRWGGEIPW